VIRGGTTKEVSFVSNFEIAFNREFSRKRLRVKPFDSAERVWKDPRLLGFQINRSPYRVSVRRDAIY
jgi:hypothetical protein